MDNPGKLATLGTQDEEKQNKNTIQYALDATTIQLTAVPKQSDKKMMDNNSNNVIQTNNHR
jgi:hypothetical protein